MNLENLNLVELNALEVQHVEGGTTPGPVYVNWLGLAQNAYGHTVNVVQLGLGFLAGMGDGIRSGMN